MNNTRDRLRWQAESDAQTLASYQEILGDKARLNRAVQEAKRQASSLNKRATMLQNAASTKSMGGSISRKRK